MTQSNYLNYFDFVAFFNTNNYARWNGNIVRRAEELPSQQSYEVWLAIVRAVETREGNSGEDGDGSLDLMGPVLVVPDVNPGGHARASIRVLRADASLTEKSLQVGWLGRLVIAFSEDGAPPDPEIWPGAAYAAWGGGTVDLADQIWQHINLNGGESLCSSQVPSDDDPELILVTALSAGAEFNEGGGALNLFEQDGGEASEIVAFQIEPFSGGGTAATPIEVETRLNALIAILKTGKFPS